MGVKNIYERFIWFDDRVRAKRYPNATTLAEKFEISSKTAQRDIEFMKYRLDCPLEYDAARKGYYYENGTFSLPMIYLSSEELSSLMIARKMLQDISNGYIGKEISSIVGKLTNVLTKHMVDAKHCDDDFSFQLIEYSPAPEEVFRTALEGCLKKRRIHFTYYSPAKDERSTRKVDPYHLFNYMGTWHFIGYCHMRGFIRDFVLGRISDAKILEEEFDRPPDFDVKHYFHSSFGIYKGADTEQVTLRFTPAKSKWIKGQIWHRDQKTRFLKDGSLELSFPVADFSEVKMEILRHGDQVKVIGPKRLRDLIKDEAEKIVLTYR